MARDIRKDWSLVGYSFNGNIEYHKLKIEMERQEKNANPQTDPQEIFTAEEFWDDIIPDIGSSQGCVLARASRNAPILVEIIKRSCVHSTVA